MLFKSYIGLHVKIIFFTFVILISTSLFAEKDNSMTKPSIIFLHGGPGFKDYLKPYFKDLNKEFNCIFYDQKRGANVTTKDLVDELDQIVAAQNHKPILLGHSWGGVLAVEYAKKNSSKLNGLVLMSTGLSSSQWLQYRGELTRLGLDDAPPEKIFLTSIELENGRKLLNETSKSFSESTFTSIFEAYLKGYDLLNSLSKLSFPILNIFGEKDLRFSPIVTKTFKIYNDKIIDVEIKNAGHFPFLEKNNNKEIISTIIKEFK